VAMPRMNQKMKRGPKRARQCVTFFLGCESPQSVDVIIIINLSP
jgi:hypothetical protein